jgi:hypothetical protein
MKPTDIQAEADWFSPGHTQSIRSAGVNDEHVADEGAVTFPSMQRIRRPGVFSATTQLAAPPPVG